MSFPPWLLCALLSILSWGSWAFLGERLHWHQGIGALVAVAAGVLFGVEGRTDGNRGGR